MHRGERGWCVKLCLNLHAILKLSQPATQEVCAWVQELARAIKEAWKRAKIRGKEDEVYKKNGRRPL